MKEDKQTEILIVDDEPVMRELLAQILRSHGHQHIRFAEDGQRAIDLLASQNCDIALAFIDLNMPGFNGIEVLTLARTLRPHCHCIVVSGHSDLDHVTAAIGAGARGFIVKPYSVKKISDMLARYERERASGASA